MLRTELVNTVATRHSQLNCEGRLFYKSMDSKWSAELMASK